MLIVVDVLHAHNTNAITGLVRPQQVALAAQHIEIAIAAADKRLVFAVLVYIGDLDGQHAMREEVAPFEMALAIEDIEVTALRAYQDLDGIIAIDVLDANSAHAILRLVLPQKRAAARVGIDGILQAALLFGVVRMHDLDALGRVDGPEWRAEVAAIEIELFVFRANHDFNRSLPG